jgi:hypothetical protein
VSVSEFQGMFLPALIFHERVPVTGDSFAHGRMTQAQQVNEEDF